MATYNRTSSGGGTVGHPSAALTGLKFQFSRGNIDAGTIKLYGIR